MPSTRKRTKRTNGSTTSAEQQREDVRRALKRQHAREREIQSLTKRLDREMQRSNDMLQRFGTVLAARARALEAERESALALER